MRQARWKDGGQGPCGCRMSGKGTVTREEIEEESGTLSCRTIRGWKDTGSHQKRLISCWRSQRGQDHDVTNVL